jgi:PTS system nitrogen regulatory IIA component
MKLALEELARALNIPPETVERWIRQGSIPVRLKAGACVFSRHSLEKWARENNLTFEEPGTDSRQLPEDRPDNLSTAMTHGGVFYDLEGETIAEILRAGVDRVPFFDTHGKRQTLYDSLLAREELMSTGIGKGVAVPHPRTPLDYGDIPALITTCFLRHPADYKAVDHQPVFVLFFLICPSARRHLHLLARLSFCLRDESFIAFLKQHPDRADFFEKIAVLDQRFEGPPSGR